MGCVPTGGHPRRVRDVGGWSGLAGSGGQGLREAVALERRATVQANV